MGVRRAVEMVLDAPNKHEGPIFTCGPLIHNPQILNLLEEKGISILPEIPDHGSGTVLIRAHGVPPQAKEDLKAAGFKIIDATCPRVIKVQTIIRKHSKQGYASIIIGDKNHPEVVGLLGFAGEKGYVVNNLDDLKTLPPFDRAIIVAQTTQNMQFFEKVKNWADQKSPQYKIFDTICDSTAKRQTEVRQLACGHCRRRPQQRQHQAAEGDCATDRKTDISYRVRVGTRFKGPCCGTKYRDNRRRLHPQLGH